LAQQRRTARRPFLLYPQPIQQSGVESAAPHVVEEQTVRITKTQAFALVLTLLWIEMTATPSRAQQNWPTRPVRFIVPFGPGAGADIGSRLFAEKLSAKWGQPVVIENRPGGDSIIAIQAFLSANDDHTFLFVRDCGYRVVEAASTDEAIVILQKTNIPVDVVLSEIDIPGSMNGFGFAQWARPVRPELKIQLAGTPGRTVRNAARQFRLFC
jgi:hypothetical protein